ncbi:DUF222 domain-containing protein, partial [Mycobacterium mantenii]|uniref:DUF222 domain-containing protein n=1 Tax=Mycobacterium mantenii TaxID=560555 RepID=UPI000E725BD4
MRSIVDPEEIAEDYALLRRVVSRIGQHSYSALTTPEHFTYLEQLEHDMRRLRTPSHQLINQVGEQADSAELGGKLSWVLADRLHISRAEAGRRIA